MTINTTKTSLLITSLLLMALIVSPACQKAPAEFEIASLEIAPLEVAAGEPVGISAEVRNIGGTAGTYTATLTIDGLKIQTKVVKVAPGTTEAVAFVVVRDEPGTYHVEVNELSGTLSVVKPAEFTVSNLVINPAITEVGEAVTVAADVTNTGEVEGSYSAALLIDGSQVETRELTVAPGATETVSFAFTEEASGIHAIGVGGLSGLLMATETGDALVELTAALSELCDELIKLPDLKEIDDKDTEAIEDIAYLALNPKHREAFQSMLDEGIKDKRKYCASLEALLWIAYDREFDGYDPVSKLINDGWKNTTTSKNYTSEKWQDFDEVVDRLSSPELVTTYCIDNFPYDLTKWKAYLATGQLQPMWPPLRTFSEKKGACMDQSAFAFHCLSQNGYSYDNFDVHKNHAACILHASPSPMEGGHFTCLYIQDGEFYIIDAGTPYVRGIKGPFKTIEEAADATCRNWGAYGFFNAGNLTKEVTRKR